MSLETPDAEDSRDHGFTRPALANQLLSNLVTIPMIPEGTVDQQRTQPIGTGPFKFVSLDQSQNTVELAANHGLLGRSSKGTRSPDKDGYRRQLSAGRAANRGRGLRAEPVKSAARHLKIAGKPRKFEGPAVGRLEHSIRRVQYAVAAAE